MNAEQNQRIAHEISNWRDYDLCEAEAETATESDLIGMCSKMAALLQELVDAPEAEPVACDLRMDAYYYGFDQTGVPAIDRILSAVACAGKAFHHTSQWQDECSPYVGHVGGTPAEWIQNAANDAARICAAPPAPSVPDGWRELAKQSADALRVFTGHDFAVNLRYRYGENWCEPLNALEKKLCAILAATPTPAEPPADLVRDAERFVALINEAVANAASPIVDAMVEYEDVHGAGNTTLDGFRKAIDAAIERDKKGGA